MEIDGNKEVLVIMVVHAAESELSVVSISAS